MTSPQQECGKRLTQLLIEREAIWEKRWAAQRRARALRGGQRSAPRGRRQYQPRGGERPRPLQTAPFAENGGAATRVRAKGRGKLKPLSPMGCKKLQLLRWIPAGQARAHARGF